MYVRGHVATAEDGRQAPTCAQVEAAVDTFRLLADPTRLRLLWLLSAGQYDVGTLAALLHVPRVSTSQHLARLRAGGLVATRRDGRRVVYRARDSHVRSVIAEALFHADHTVTGLTPDHD
ncbi:MAG: winged helix-turn-helix transcriptional regulator [Geodermatophilaceae bacterium]|nr:winged helix-turn-helix transcriptional regulator [Geodermatophilaceae bacterium]MDQ3456525.1 metalloregulator ArsR/SmtB family transcription factor [Actinomycetota bacterium]